MVANLLCSAAGMIGKYQQIYVHRAASATSRYSTWRHRVFFGGTRVTEALQCPRNTMSHSVLLVVVVEMAYPRWL